jgi:predicted metal-dependent hydrolase
MPPAEREMWIDRMRRRIQRQLKRARPTELDLERRARLINRRYFGGRLSWNSIAYAPQQRLWGSCTFTAGVIRISDRGERLPGWVLDYILVHELAHLVHADHGPAFWELVARYPPTERARGYLMALDELAGATPSPRGG